ncbi:LysR family transcriptional regulator [Corallococcus praedator]|uniref:LysR family transcriptional regulator n=1 Tax=Corallococcus praedator TaxID=2316724 RepID=A0ABX9QPX9_9BACT|nr:MULTISPECIES: LysR family transcriptional regulator [Corallococcus]RKH23247.1 LysR family transcriptional regulator [Corallococcus sp. CA031C]RKI15974.1 LysR family transcriptional regulator [Corallococcus praedator]
MKTVLFHQLHVFLAVARLQSFRGAARELGVSTAAVSQSVRQLEEQLSVVLLNRTSRSVALTDVGRRLVEEAGPGLAQAAAALQGTSAQPGEVVGRLRLSVPRAAVPLLIAPVLPAFRARYPRVEVDVVVEQRLVDIVAEGYDAGVRLSETLERDMVQVRLTGAFRFVIVGAPAYLEARGTPERPEDLLRHDCIVLRSPTTGTPYAWELERGSKTWRVPMREGVSTNDELAGAALAAEGGGLAYVLEPAVQDQLLSGRLVRVLEDYAPTVPGFFLYYPSRAQRSKPLRLFVEAAKELAGRTG